MALIDDINNLPEKPEESVSGHLNHHSTIHESLKDHAARLNEIGDGVSSGTGLAMRALSLGSKNSREIRDLAAQSPSDSDISDAISGVTEQLETKADKSEVTEQLETKADKSEVTEQLETKADKSEVSTTTALSVSALSIGRKNTTDIQNTAQAVADLEGLTDTVDTIDTLVSGVESRVSGVETRVSGVESGVSGVDTRVSGVESRVSGVEAMSGITPESPVDGQTANLIGQDDTLTRAALTSAATRVVHQSLPEYIIGPTGEYATVMDFLVDHPTGDARVVLQAGVHHVDQLPSDGSLKNFQMVGMGRGMSTIAKYPTSGTTVQTTGPLIETTETGEGNLYFADFNLRNITETNTDNGIKIEYPRLVKVERLNILGYGGSSIWFVGGLNSEINENYINARDFNAQNGFAAIHLSYRGVYNGSNSTTHTRHNYVTGSRNYGYYYDGVMQGTMSIGDIAEYCQQAFYFNRAGITLIAPYTEANVNEFYSYNCNPLIIGRTRNELVQEWSSAVFLRQRRAARYAESWLDMGQGITMGIAGGGAYGDFEQSMSIKAGTHSPNGYAQGTAGSLYFQKDANFGKGLWQKQTDTGLEGWLPIGHFSVSRAELQAEGNWVNKHKYHGMMVWCHDLAAHVYASGADPDDPWLKVGTDEQMVPTPTD